MACQLVTIEKYTQMEKGEVAMKAQTSDIAFQSSQINGMNVHILPTAKFKTTTIVTMIEQALSEEHVTKTALLAMVMKRASERFPETKLLRAHLDFCMAPFLMWMS